MSDRLRHWATHEKVYGWYFILGAILIPFWSVFHTVEQWSFFNGKLEWLLTMRRNGSGILWVTELGLGVFPVIAFSLFNLLFLCFNRSILWAGLTDSGLGKRVDALGAVGTFLFNILLLGHVLHFWFAHRVLGYEVSNTYNTLTHATIAHVFLHVSFFVTFAWHIMSFVPRAAAYFFNVEEEQLKSLRLICVCAALCQLVLTVQLYGFAATGAGPFWNIQMASPAAHHAE